jgi:restriction system protein
MSVPTYEEFMRPVLELLELHGPLSARDIRTRAADMCNLSAEDRAAVIPSGAGLVGNRVNWAVSYLVQAGAIKRPSRATAEITDRGRELLGEQNGPLSSAILMQFPEFVAFKTEKPPAAAPTTHAGRRNGAATTPLTGTPEEVIEQALDDAHSALKAELLGRLVDLDSTAFELLMLRLLEAMEYVAAGKIGSTPQSGDAGIDGVISRDPLGLDRIYVQAKRYALDEPVRRPAMHNFVDALHEQQADRGVFMTTSSFTKEALLYAGQVGVRVMPIDGQQVTALMLKHRVGVQSHVTAVLLGLDDDFFEQV